MSTQRVLVGDALTTLRGLESGSVNLCVTSPPYFNLRDYGTAQWQGGDPECDHRVRLDPRIESSTLGGGEMTTGHQRDGFASKCPRCGATRSGQVWAMTPEQEGCEHEWGESLALARPVEKRTAEEFSRNSTLGPNRDGLKPSNAGHAVKTTLQPTSGGAFCRRCSAWRGELGAEPTVDLFVAHLVAVFREVRRVLHERGLLFVVIGDSYARPPGKGVKFSGGDGAIRHQQAVEGIRGPEIPEGTKEKDLLLVPQALAFALRADGWWIRSIIPWVKFQSCMPESSKDRPTSAIEYVLMCAKSKRPFGDQEAAKRASSSPEQEAHNFRYAKAYRAHTERTAPNGQPGNVNNVGIHGRPGSGGRQYRNADGFLHSLDAAIAAQRAHLARLEAVRESGGLLTDEDGAPLALLVNPQPFTARSLGLDSIDHFAAYPPKLVEPLISAACPERCCSVCGAPWERVVERSGGKSYATGKSAEKRAQGLATAFSGYDDGSAAPTVRTLGFRPTCTCDAPCEPGTVLDCFAGTGTTAVTAAKLGRSSISIELSPAYARIIERNLNQRGAPLFSETTVTPAPANGHRQAAMEGIGHG